MSDNEVENLTSISKSVLPMALDKSEDNYHQDHLLRLSLESYMHKKNTVLERPIQTLNAVEKGEEYISHILSRNNMEDGDLDMTILVRESWRRENLSEGKRSQSLKMDDKVVEMISSCSNLKGPGL